jgi:hypothetical protein
MYTNDDWILFHFDILQLLLTCRISLFFTSPWFDVDERITMHCITSHHIACIERGCLARGILGRTIETTKTH